MPELPEMPDVNEPERIRDTDVKLNSITCAGGCQNHGTLTAVFYTPVVLILSGLVALAAFPEIAEYATPWIGETVSKQVCTSVNKTSAGSSQCGFMNDCSNTSCSTSVNAPSESCNDSELFGTTDTTMASEQSKSTKEIEGSSEVTRFESPADALSFENTEPTTGVSN